MRQRELSIAKITRPRLTAVYGRKRLFELLDQGRKKPVVWISGPAGSGKTTLVGSYLDARKLPCLWYQVDEGDADIATFFYYLGLATKKVAPRIKRPLPLLTPEYLLGIPTFTRRFFENLYSRLSPPFVLVFDNYHDVPDQSPLNEVMQTGLSTIPEGITAVVISRAEPPPLFTRMLAGNTMQMIGWEELRLSAEESRAIALLHLGEGRNDEAISWIHEKTGGWAAGLILLAKLIKREAFDPQLLNTVGSEQVFDYFANELFDKRANEVTRDFLLKTAILPKITPSVAERLTGNRDAGQILSELNRRNYFTEKRLGPELSYQYHPLFREFLQSRAEAAFTPTERAHLQAAAAELLEQAGQIEDAADLFRAAGDGQGLSRMIQRHAPVLVGQGRYRTLEQWLEHLPADMRETTPWLLYWKGMCRLPFDPAGARGDFEKAFALFKPGTDSVGLCLSWCGVIDSVYYEWGDFSPLDRWIAELRKTIEPRLPRAQDILVRVTGCAIMAFTYRQPHHPGAQRWMKRAEKLVDLLADYDQKALLLARMMHFIMWVSDVPRCLRLLDELTSITRSNRSSPLTLLFTKVMVINLLWVYRGDGEGSLRVLRETLQLVEEAGINVFGTSMYAQGVYAALTAGDLAAAQEFFDKSRRQLNPARNLDYGHHFYLAAWLELLRGNVREAYENIQQAFATAVKGGAPFPLALNHIALSHVLFEMGEYRNAESHLAEGRTIGRKMKSAILEFKCLLAGAYYALMRKQERKGLQLLKKALQEGKEKGFVNIDWWLPRVMSFLLGRALEEGIEMEYTRELILRRKLVPDSPPYHIELWPWPLKIFTFGKFVVQRNGAPLAYAHKAPKKPLELLRLLVALGGKNVGEARLMELLWPDAQGDAAHKALGVAVVRLRELLGVKEALQVKEGAVSLDERYAWNDARAFEKLVQEADEELQRQSEKGGWGESGKRRGAQKGARDISPVSRFTHSPTLRALEKAVSLYRGPFLGDEKQFWIIGPRERFRDAFLRAVEVLGARWERKRQWRKAVDVYDRGLAVDDLIEKFYVRMIECHLRLGSQAEALAVHRRLRKTLKAYGVAPSSESEEVYRTILSKKPEK